jgi:hypothetical protein
MGDKWRTEHQRSRGLVPLFIGLFATAVAVYYRTIVDDSLDATDDDIEAFLQQRGEEATASRSSPANVLSACCGQRGLRAFDNALPAKLFDAVKQEVATIEPRLTALDSANGWWWSVEQEPRFVIEAAIQKLHKLMLESCAARGKEIKGGEWWIQRRGNTNATINFHWDKDVGLKILKGENSYPVVSTVTYLGDTGGPTLVFNQTEEEVNQSEQEDQQGGQILPAIPDFSFLVHPRTNRHIQFDGRLYHGVVGQLAQQRAKKARYTLLVNWWVSRPDTVFPLDLRMHPTGGADYFRAKSSFDNEGVKWAAEDVAVMGGEVGMNLNRKIITGSWPIARQHEIIELIGRTNRTVLGAPVTELMLLPVPVPPVLHVPTQSVSGSKSGNEDGTGSTGAGHVTNNGVYAIDWRSGNGPSSESSRLASSESDAGEWRASRGVVVMDMHAEAMSSLLQPHPLPRAVVFVDGANHSAALNVAREMLLALLVSRLQVKQFTWMCTLTSVSATFCTWILTTRCPWLVPGASRSAIASWRQTMAVLCLPCADSARVTMECHK